MAGSRQLKTLSSSGIITVADLAQFMEINDAAIITGLEKHNIPILKLTKYHTSWVVRLEDIKGG